MAKAKNLALSLSTAIITFSAGCSSNSTNGSVQNLVEQQEEVVASKSNLPLAKSIQVANPGNKFTKVVFIHLTQKEVSNGLGIKALGEAATSIELTIENLDTGDTATETFSPSDKIILGSLIVGGNYKITSKALLSNGDVIAIAESIIFITDTISDIYLNYISVPNPTPVETKDVTVTTDGVIVDTRVPVSTPKPTLSSFNNGLSLPTTIANNGAQLPKIVRNGSDLFVMTINNGYPEIYKSTNEGLNFSKVNQTSLGASVQNQIEFDFTGNNGVLYFTWSDKSNSQVYISKSIDGGQTWNTQTKLSEGFIWANNPNTYIYNDMPYTLFRGYKNSKIELYLVSPDGNTVQVTNNSNQEDNGKIVVDSSGIYVAYQDTFNTNNIYLQKSTDGITFENPIQINRTSGKSNGFNMALNSKGDLFVGYSDTTTDYEGDLYVAKLSKDVNTLTYQKASDDNYRNQNSVQIFIDSTDSIHLLWNDNSINKSYGTVAYTYSNDNGLSYKTNLILDKNGGISNGSLTAKSNSIDIVTANYNTSPISTSFYKVKL